MKHIKVRSNQIKNNEITFPKINSDGHSPSLEELKEHQKLVEDYIKNITLLSKSKY